LAVILLERFLTGRDDRREHGAAGVFAPMAVILACLFAIASLGGGVLDASAVRGCECAWGGPFYRVAPRAEAVVRLKVLRYRGTENGIPASMEAEVLEVLKGTVAEKHLRIWGGKGWLCRPEVTQFPVGTEWILALDGPGSKYAIEGDHAVSVCGAYWLEVRDGCVRGNLTDEKDIQAVQVETLEVFRAKLARAIASYAPTP
jgi:hypothetical protein